MEFAHRDKHIYIIGKSGVGKSTLLEHIADADIRTRKSLIVIDPHGSLARNVLSLIPPSRTDDVCYIDLSDTNHAVGFNPLLGNETNAAKASADLTAAFKDIFADSWGPRLEWFLYNGLVALNEKGNRDLTDLPRLYYDAKHRRKLTDNIKDSVSREFWHKEYPSYDDRYRKDASGPILNKVGQVIASPHLRDILCVKHPKFSLSKAIRGKKIVIVNLAKGIVGDAPSMLFGSLIVSKLASLIFEFTEPCNVSIIADEFQNYSSEIWASLFSEIRKYGGQLTVAHQFVKQLPETVRASVLGNAGTIIAFAIGADDAPFLVNHFGLQDQYMGGMTNVTPIQQLTTTPPYQAIIKTPDTTSRDITLPPPLPYMDNASIIKDARERFARPRL